MRGFTLIELLVAMVIVGLLMAVAASQLSTSSYAGTVKGFANEISSEIATTRLRAMSSRRWHRIEFNRTDVTVWRATTTGMAAPVAYELINTLTVPGNVVVQATSNRTHLAANDSVPAIGVGVPGALDLAPDGGGEAKTVFIGNNEKATDKVRVAIYRVSGAAYVLDDW